jgi:hypothetical protein
VSDNPFRKALEGGDSIAAPAAPATVETVSTPADADPTTFEAALDSVPDDVDDVHPLEDEDEAAVAQAETVEKDGRKREVVSKETFLKRVRSLTAKRRTAETERDTAKAEVERVKAQIQQVKPVLGVAQRYKGKEHQLAWDVDFIDTFEQMAQADPDLQSVAQRILSNMKKGKTVSNTDVTRDTVAAPAQQTPGAQATPAQAQQSELLVVTERVVNRDARRLLTETLTGAGVEERFVKAITNAAMKDLSVAQRAELDSDKVLAFTKKYLKANELTAKDILKAAETPAPKPKPPTVGDQGKPAPAAKPASAEKKAEGPKFKSYEEYKEHRRAGIARLAEELNLNG